MYPKAILISITTPLLPGSVYGILTGLALTVLFMARIMWEENLLGQKLPGSREYILAVYYRLLSRSLVKYSHFFRKAVVNQ